MTNWQEIFDSVEERIERKIDMTHTAFPAKIVKYDAETGMADVQPIGQMAILDNSFNYPVVPSVPILFPSCGGCSIVFPVSEGDECLVICCENSVEPWINGTETAFPSKKSLDNAVAIMLSAKKSDGLKIDNGKCSIVMTDKVTINGDLTVTGRINP